MENNEDNTLQSLLTQDKTVREDEESSHVRTHLKTDEQDEESEEMSDQTTDDATHEKKERKIKKHKSKTGAEGTKVTQTISDGISTEQQQQQQQVPLPQYANIQYNTQPIQHPPQQSLQMNSQQQPPQINHYPQQIPQINNSKQPFTSAHYSNNPNNPQPFTITQQPQQFGGPQFQRQMVVRGPPSNYMTLSWMVCLFCCWPIGIAAIMSSSKVNNLYATGNFEEADRESRRAKALVISGILLGPLLVTICYGLRMITYDSS